ncbi:MAG: hypothetical protein EOP04_02810 [Proteobacteria bacterium]|nr:MAG: hypothetical protein EOP04_02810 [Pseudomonadota bacterium]
MRFKTENGIKVTADDESVNGALEDITLMLPLYPKVDKSIMLHTDIKYSEESSSTHLPDQNYNSEPNAVLYMNAAGVRFNETSTELIFERRCAVKRYWGRDPFQ